jgi:hypothetical protein
MLPRVARQFVRKGRKFGPTWRFVFNLAPTVLWGLSENRLSGEAFRVLESLNQQGVAITSASELLERETCFPEMTQSVEDLELRMAGQLAEARGRADDSEIGQKSFIVPLLGENPLLDPQSVFARFALERPVLQIANAYLGMYSRLRYFNVWHTLATRSRPRESQLWHRDREDRMILKVFVHLSDIDRGAGPFTYAAGTHLKGKLKVSPAFTLEGGVRRSDDHQMEAVAPSHRWVECVGAAGTIVFADTGGFHKGGLARQRDRILYTSMYTSPACESREFLNRTAGISRPGERDRIFALAPPKSGPWLSANPW